MSYLLAFGGGTEVFGDQPLSQHCRGNQLDKYPMSMDKKLYIHSTSAICVLRTGLPPDEDPECWPLTGDNPRTMEVRVGSHVTGHFDARHPAQKHLPCTSLITSISMTTASLMILHSGLLIRERFL
ncbi:unnamed protein product [Caretta caretta]